MSYSIPLFEFLKEDVLSENREDKYVCLSILCEQRENMDKKDIEKQIEHFVDMFLGSPLSEKEYQIAMEGAIKKIKDVDEQMEDFLHMFTPPSGKAYQIKMKEVIKKIDEVTSKVLPVELVETIAKYDNPFQHRLFDNKNNNNQAKELLIETKNDYNCTF